MVDRAEVPSLRAVDFADDLGRVDVPGLHDELFARMVKFMKSLDHFGAQFHTRDGQRRRPTRFTPWLGFTVDTADNVVGVEDQKVAGGMSSRHKISKLRPGSCMVARAHLSPVSFLNVVLLIAPAVFAAFEADEML